MAYIASKPWVVGITSDRRLQGFRQSQIDLTSPSEEKHSVSPSQAVRGR